MSVRIFEVLLSLLVQALHYSNSICRYRKYNRNRGSCFIPKSVGKDGVCFEILKFRTMVSNAETNGAVYNYK
jgi:lipopolysaccharide/colanic/teichoic acid biosynthesis glycosyltransferase